MPHALTLLTWYKHDFSLVSECTRSLVVSHYALTRNAFAGTGGFSGFRESNLTGKQKVVCRMRELNVFLVAHDANVEFCCAKTGILKINANLRNVEFWKVTTEKWNSQIVRKSTKLEF